MTDARSWLIDALRRVRAGQTLTNDELLAAIPDPRELDSVERIAWQRLSHWADDDDIRAKDPSYAEMQQREAAEALADLEALEIGFLPTEIARGDHNGTHIPIVGCILTIMALALVFYLMFANGFFMHGD